MEMNPGNFLARVPMLQGLLESFLLWVGFPWASQLLYHMQSKPSCFMNQNISWLLSCIQIYT